MNKQLSLFFLIVVIFLGAGCENDQEKYIIPKDEFVDILVDIHLMDGIMRQPNIRKSLFKKDTTDYYSAILKTHDYSREQFDSSMVYYSRNIREFDDIYQDVLSTLNQMEAETEDELDKQKRKKELQRKKAEKDQQERLGNPYKIELGSKVKIEK
ncbi:MAG: DUF4296 domain-containing protein [Bacteroidota bacterium]